MPARLGRGPRVVPHSWWRRAMCALLPHEFVATSDTGARLVFRITQPGEPVPAQSVGQRLRTRVASWAWFASALLGIYVGAFLGVAVGADHPLAFVAAGAVGLALLFFLGPLCLGFVLHAALGEVVPPEPDDDDGEPAAATPGGGSSS